jgi:hypothetical protein
MTDHLGNLRYGAAMHMLSIPSFFCANNTPALIMMAFLLSPFQLKQLPHTTVQESLFRPEDILQFVTSKVPEGMPAQVNLAVFFQRSITPVCRRSADGFFGLPHAGYEEHF